MEFLRFLVFAIVWGFMWHWVVKNRGSWGLLFGNIAGAVSGFMVGAVMLSITLSIFPSKPKPEQAVPAAAEVSTPAKQVAADNLPEFVFIPTEAKSEDSPPESALLPYNKSMLPNTLSEKMIRDLLPENGRSMLDAMQQKIGDKPDADKTVLALTLCQVFISGKLRFPQSGHLANSPGATSQRYKDQTYTIHGQLTADNNVGQSVPYKFECSLQYLATEDGDYARWHLLDLKVAETDR
ncbi:hypothetical protein [Pseudomonas frederiksbergensis]|uniref:hypothetical protein n=1 Tax=Pseudomonas frederiksbergensis TaxID=104087 RepID=UPI000F4ACE2F|nr:hypothetical protein [Pseudomonas frederiksbergensis]RON42934.1 hypothetical protein BK667_30495 [Pseudomonas frederiksbergensis]